MVTTQLPDRLNAATVFVDDNLEQGRGSKAAIVCGQRVATYHDVYESVNRFGNLLRELGIRRGERVAILMPDLPEWVTIFFGSIKAGAVAVPLNTNLAANDYQYLLNDCGASLLVVHLSLLGKIEQLAARGDVPCKVMVSGADQGCGFLDFDALMPAASPALQAAETGRYDTAFFLYSSGTTGPSKAAVHRHQDMLVCADSYARGTLGLGESDTTFSVAKLFFAYGLGNGLYFPFFVGATSILMPERPMPEQIFSVMDKHHPTVFFGVPTSYVQLLQYAEPIGRTDLGRVRLCVSASEPLPGAVFEKWRSRFGVEILDGLGSTEALHIYISNRPGQILPGSTGRVVPGYQAKIVDDDGKPASQGSVGTLMLKGESVTSGYWNRPEATDKMFVDGWLNTRDKMLQDENGYYWYMGRTDDMFKVDGQAVWPTDVEGTLMRHPAVLESGVVGGVDAHGLVKPVAFVTLNDGFAPTPALEEELQVLVKKSGAPHKYPRVVVFVDELPKTSTGKIKRFEIRETMLDMALFP